LVSVSHSSAKEFINYLRFLHENPISSIQSGPNKEFQKIHEEKIKKLNQSNEHQNVSSSHNHIAKELWESLRGILPSQIVDDLSGVIAVGALDNMSVNALCAKSVDGYIAVLINTGLMTLLNKLSKMQIASTRPGSIRYCNRAQPEDISVATLKKWNLEVCEHYRHTGKPLGPQIHLHSDAEGMHATQLNIWEMYVLSHEIGHILCGHLDSSKFVTKNPLFGMIETLEENKSHEMESEADFIGYILLREYYHKGSIRKSPNNESIKDDRGLVSILITFYNLLYLLGASESTTHPHPLDRLCNIVLNAYGEKVAETLADSYDNHGLLIKLFERPLVVKNMAIEGILSNAE